MRYAIVGGLFVALGVAGALWWSELMPRKKHVTIESGKAGTKHVRTMSGVIRHSIKIDYLLQLPHEYDKKTDTQWPLILFLHGSGERLWSAGKLATLGPAREATRRGLPFIVLTPHCPKDKWWADAEMTVSVMELLKSICETHRVDPARVYVTGMSMGGIGAWSLAQQYPDCFAALA
ncbi:MAG: hypothetical protein HN909_04060, partial [Phycisphaerales bacterium]|nr:hypothetical protein [Phycisphaerales bacterium]